MESKSTSMKRIKLSFLSRGTCYYSIQHYQAANICWPFYCGSTLPIGGQHYSLGKHKEGPRNLDQTEDLQA